MVFSSTICHPKTLIETCTCRSYIHLNSPFMCSTRASAICKLLKTAIIFYLYHPLPHEKSWFLEYETFLSPADKMQCLTIIQSFTDYPFFFVNNKKAGDNFHVVKCGRLVFCCVLPVMTCSLPFVAIILTFLIHQRHVLYNICSRFLFC